MNEQAAVKMLETIHGANSRSPTFHAATSGHTVKFLIVDDHAITRRGISSVLNNLSGTRVIIFEAATLESAHDQLLNNPDTDILVLDLILPGYGGCDSLQHIRNLHPALPTIIISAHDEPQLIQEAMQLGAISFIPKSSSRKVIVAAIELILAGGTYLPQQLFPSFESSPFQPPPSSTKTIEHSLRLEHPGDLSPCQRDILIHLLQGKTNREIAESLELTIGTVKHYVNSLLRLCGVHKRSQLFLHYRFTLTENDAPPAIPPEHH